MSGEIDLDDAILAWLRYHVETETFDHILTAHRDPRSGCAVVHHDPWIRQQSISHARDAARRLLDRLPRDLSQRAKSVVTEWDYETQLERLAQMERE